MTKSEVTVSGVAKTLDLFSGEATGETSVTFSVNTTPMYSLPSDDNTPINIASVPVRHNFRTNLIGASVLTDDASFDIVIDPIYDGEYNETINSSNPSDPGSDNGSGWPGSGNWPWWN